MTEEVTKFHEQLEDERKEREETQTQMFRMIEDIHQRVQTDIQREKKEREEAEESLLRLLEETCNRVESSLQGQLF